MFDFNTILATFPNKAKMRVYLNKYENKYKRSSQLFSVPSA